jgi:hypothetical protein
MKEGHTTAQNGQPVAAIKLKYTEAAEFELFDERGKEIQEKNRRKFDVRIEVKRQRKTQ